MPSFTTDQDLYNFVGGIFEKAYQDPDLGPKLSKSGAVLLVKCTDPASEVVLDMPSKKVYPSAEQSPVPPNATMRMSTDIVNSFWQGKVNLTIAMARGQVKTEGAIMKVLRLVPNTPPLFSMYIDLLKRSGREDLLV